MNLIFETEDPFVIKNGNLLAQSGSKFTVLKSGNDITITDSFCCANANQYNDFRGTTLRGNAIGVQIGSNLNSGHGISINNGTISINGFKIRVNKGVVTIDGCAAEIIYNGTNLLATDNFSSKEKVGLEENLKENEHKVYALNSGSIDAIIVKNCGGVSIEDATVLSIGNLSLSVKGSGKISLNTDKKETINNVNASVMGSGDIVLINLRAYSLNASIMGSGDIRVKQSELSNASLSVMGSGDIIFHGSTADNVQKSLLGSGDINGI